MSTRVIECLLTLIPLLVARSIGSYGNSISLCIMLHNNKNNNNNNNNINNIIIIIIIIIVIIVIIIIPINENVKHTM